MSSVTCWDEFVAAFNKGFFRKLGGEWNDNLDAFNGYLWWPDEHPYRLIIYGWLNCRVGQPKASDGPALRAITEIFSNNLQAEVVFA